MDTKENNNQITLSEAAKQLGIEIYEAADILKRYANLSPLKGDSEISVHGIFQARVLEWGAIAFSEETA